MARFLDRVPKKADFTAELEALRRFYIGEEIGDGLTIEELLERIINKGLPRLNVIKGLHDRYSIENVPILHERLVCDPMEIDNRLNNDFFSEIVDEKSGYFAGNPMTFTFEESERTAAENFDEFKVRTRLDDINYETTKNCAIGGYDGRLIYIKNDIVGFDSNNKPIYKAVEAIKQIPAYEVIFLGDSGYDEAEFAVRYTKHDSLSDGEVHRVELYMPFKTYVFTGGALGDLEPSNEFVQEFNLDGEVVREVGVAYHPFSKCPLYGYENNAELLGDAERVLSLIDAYDRTMSDTDSELEANRGAYLAFFGVEPPDEDYREDTGDSYNSKSTGTLYFPGASDIKQDAKFIIKDLPVAAKEAHLERLEDNIYRFSKTPNLTEKTTGMAVSGEALRQRMMPMENKTGSFERKMVSGNLRMLECLADSYKLRGIELSPYKVTQIFKRKLPENLEYEARLIELFKGNLPMEQIYALLSFVDNPQELADWYEIHKDDMENEVYYQQSSGEVISSATMDNTNSDLVDK